MKRFRFIIFLFLLFLLNSCASTSSQFAQESGSISVMTYNFENLFDAIHDEGTEDYSYLPMSEKENDKHKRRCQNIRSRKYRAQCLEMDWNKDVVETKMRRLADSILQVNKGKGPDLLIVEEVENERVLKQLNEQYLKAANYQTLILIEGFDKRGIDVAFLSRLKQKGKAQLHKIPYKGRNEEDKKWMARSRGILQGDFILPDGQTLTAFALHFPSPRNPTYWRQQAIEHLNGLQAKLPKENIVVAGGDFNISGEEESRDKLYQKDLAKKWLVSHEIGCGDCRGTNYYHFKRQWSFLDALLFSKNLDPKEGKASWEVVTQSIGIPKDGKYQMNRWMSPARFEPLSPVGVSDHWPMYAEIRPRKAKDPQTVAGD